MKKTILASATLVLLLAFLAIGRASAFELNKPPSQVVEPPTAPHQALVINGYRVPPGAIIDNEHQTITLPDGTTCKLTQLTSAGCPRKTNLDPMLPTAAASAILAFAAILAAIKAARGKKRGRRGWRPSTRIVSTILTASAAILLLAVQSLPPVSAATPPLDTSKISIMAWEKVADYIQLNKTLTIYANYTWGGNYIDGQIIIADGKNNPYTPGSDGNVLGYIKVDVRVRADGYIIAYLKRESAGGYQYGGRPFLLWTSFRDKDDGGSTPGNATVLSQAIYIATKAAGLSPNRQTIFNQAKYYDYEYPEAKRLIIFGKWGGGRPSYFYFTPIDVKVIKAYTVLEYKAICDRDYKIDGTVVKGKWYCKSLCDKPHNDGADGFWVGEITSYINANNTRHTFEFDGYWNNNKVWVVVLLGG